MTRNKNLVAWLCVLLAAAGAGFYFFHAAKNPAAPAAGARAGFAGGAARPAPVVAAAAAIADVPVQLDALGSVTPVATVTVRSRVDGELVKILFREGQVVRAGDLLAEIDSRSYRVQLAQAEAQLARDAAQLKNAQLDLQRYQELFKLDSVARQQLDTQEALVGQAEATVRIDRAAIDTIRLQLSYCRITAPVSGRLGLRMVDLGNIVHAGDANGLVVITQLRPITVVFSIPEDNLPAVMKKLRAGDQPAVYAYDRAGKVRLASGMLLTADNQIDPATGTVKLKAQFANDDLALFPSQFVNVRMIVDVLRSATVVPGAAVQRGTPGTFVYVIDPATKAVSVRPVKLGPAQGEQVALAQGLQPGALVVVDGADKLRDGAIVEMVVRAPAVQGTAGDERARRWKALNARIDKGEFGEEIRKLPEEQRKQRLRELRAQKRQ